MPVYFDSRVNICKGGDNPLAPTWRALPKQNQRNLFRGDRLHRLHLHLRRRQALPPLPRVAQAPSHLQHICLHQVSIFTFSGVLVPSYIYVSLVFSEYFSKSNSYQCFDGRFHNPLRPGDTWPLFGRDPVNVRGGEVSTVLHRCLSPIHISNPPIHL